MRSSIKQGFWNSEGQATRSVSNMVPTLWLRLLDREKIPRRWWWPPYSPIRQPGQDSRKKQHSECSKTIQHIMLTLIGFCFFCFLALGVPDESLLGAGAKITLPFAGVAMDFLAFLFIGPAVLIGLTIYLHIFVGYWEALGARSIPERPLFLFNLDAPIPKLLSGFLLYWLVPVVLSWFTWKASARPEAPLFVFLTIMATAALVWVQIRRCPDYQRDQNQIRWAILISLIVIALLCFKNPMLFRRPLNLYKVDLHEKDLRYSMMTSAFLREADLTGADLSGANLHKADLSGAHLHKADLTGADLSGARLLGADLHEADLHETDLHKADLTEAHLTGANLSRTQLGRAILSRVDLSGKYLTGADLHGANLRGADLTGADLSWTNFTGADLTEAHLYGANFSRANLAWVHIYGATFSGANLSGANLSGVNLSGARNLTEARIEWAIINEETVFPVDLKVYTPPILATQSRRNRPPAPRFKRVPVTRVKRSAKKAFPPITDDRIGVE